MVALKNSVLIALALVILTAGFALAGSKTYDKYNVSFQYPDTWNVLGDMKDDRMQSVIVASPSNSAILFVTVEYQMADPMTRVDDYVKTWTEGGAAPSKQPYQEKLTGVLFKGYRITGVPSDGTVESIYFGSDRTMEGIFLGAVINKKVVVIQWNSAYPRNADDEAGISQFKSSLKVQ